MNKMKSLLAVIGLLLSTNVFAFDIEVDSVFYNVSFEDMTCEVTSGNIIYTGDIVIPNHVTYNGKTLSVTKIGPGAFSRCSITSITIGDSITEISDNTFNGCIRLEKITIGKGITKIGRDAFIGCPLTTIYSLNPIPPILDMKFNKKQLMDMNVFVPQDSLQAYKEAECWKGFWNLAEKKEK